MNDTKQNIMTQEQIDAINKIFNEIYNTKRHIELIRGCLVTKESKDREAVLLLRKIGTSNMYEYLHSEFLIQLPLEIIDAYLLNAEGKLQELETALKEISVSHPTMKVETILEQLK